MLSLYRLSSSSDVANSWFILLYLKFPIELIVLFTLFKTGYFCSGLVGWLVEIFNSLLCYLNIFISLFSSIPFLKCFNYDSSCIHLLLQYQFFWLQTCVFSFGLKTVFCNLVPERNCHLPFFACSWEPNLVLFLSTKLKLTETCLLSVFGT